VTHAAEVERFWVDCQRARPDLAACQARVRRFGSTPQLSRLLLDLIASGQKTGTFSLLSELEASGDPLPKRGDCLVVTDFDGHPGAVIRLVAVQSLPYREVSTAHTQYEGPAARDLEAWRAIHWHYWKKQLAKSGREPSEEMIVVFQQFELLHVGTA
jgi:uncharacterized protein YhfF